MDVVALAEASSDRKHRRRGVAMVTSESFDSLTSARAELHRSIGHADPPTHPDTFVAADIDHLGTVWLSVRVDDMLVGVVVLDVGHDGARIASGTGYVGLLVAPGNEFALADGLLEWLWEDMTETLAIDEPHLTEAMLAAFQGAAERLGWRVEHSSDDNTVRLSQRR